MTVAAPVLETERLTLHRLSDASQSDCAFVLRLLNDPDFLRFIGDRGVHELADAAPYLRRGPMASYAANDFGLLRVQRKSDGASIGMCGLVRREPLAHPDLGYALLPEYRSQGYVAEAGAAVLADAHARLHQSTILAVVVPENLPSIRTLRALGFNWRQDLRLPGDDTLLHLYGRDHHDGHEHP